MALSYQNYTGDNTTTQFSIPFTYQDTAEISVTVDGVAETGLTFPSSSTVQLTSAPASGTLVQVRRTTNLTARAVDFASGSVLTEEDLDDSNIQVFHAAQESVDLAGDSIQLGNDNKWDAQNSVIKNVGTPTASTDAATKGYTDTEVAGVVSSAVSQATAAATTTAQAEVAAATSTIIPDATKLAIHPIGTQYTLSDGVTSDFSSKHYANVASTNATTATNAASTASTDAGTASTAATAAQVAQAAAEAALDTFDDRFLGAKASDPSVDNDGNALLDGAIYFNTTSDIMKVYDQANTIWRDLALTGTDQTNVNLVAGQISPTNNIATVAGISADITTTATNNANITTVATSIADVNAVGTDIANVNTVATNLTDINAFADTYFISATAPASPTLGDLWFDTTNDIMKVYSASGFVNAGSSVNGTANRYVYTATSGQTTFAATYDAGYIDVYLNGVKLQNGTDFTATDGANVVLTVGAALNDQIDIVGYGTFNIAIPDISGDATPELGGDLATSGNDITFGDNDKAIFGAGSDLQIYHDGSNSIVKDAGTGVLKIQGSGQVTIEDTAGNVGAAFNANTDVALKYAGSNKLVTTATGVDVTGYIDYGPSSGNIGKIGFDSNNVYIGSTSGTGSIHFRNNIGSTDAPHSSGDDKMVITDSGVGIGTSSTNYGKFTVQNTAGTGKVLLDSYQSVPTTENVMAIYADASNGYIESYNNGYKNIIIAGSGGFVGIGTSSPVRNVDIVGATTTTASIRSTGTSPAVLYIQNSDTGTGDSNGIYLGRSAAVNYLWTYENEPWVFGTNNSEAMRIDSSGRVGIGVTSPSAVLDVKSSGATSTAFRILRSSTNTNLHAMTEISGHGRLSVYDGSENEDIRLDSNGDSYFTGGNLLVGTTSANGEGVTIRGAQGGNFWSSKSNTTSADNQLAFYNPNGLTGYIQTSGTSTSYVTSSDYRLKENVVAYWDATTRLKQLNPVRFNFIADADTTVDGFLAHEVQDVVPEAISGTKDAMRDEEYQVSAATGDIYTPAIEVVLDEDGNEVTPAVAEVIHSTDVEQPEELAEGQQWRETTAAVMGTRSVPDYQGIDQSKLVPLLVKTIQELEARIAALENV